MDSTKAVSSQSASSLLDSDYIPGSSIALFDNGETFTGAANLVIKGLSTDHLYKIARFNGHDRNDTTMDYTRLNGPGFNNESVGKGVMMDKGIITSVAMEDSCNYSTDYFNGWKDAIFESLGQLTTGTKYMYQQPLDTRHYLLTIWRCNLIIGT